ncbi:MAG TPA: PDZ domain-containing protein [Solirubrobacteraceae bacterium]|nr:PDZ domain-containing protein [Solirubrobacteraceae bacterium]
MTVPSKPSHGSRARPKRFSKAGIGVIATLLILTAVVVAAALYHPPVVLLSTTPAIDVTGDIAIKGVATSRLHGHYLILTVSEQSPSELQRVLSHWSSSATILPVAAVRPPEAPAREYRRTEKVEFVDSQTAAAAAAAEAVGLPVRLTGDGLQVVDVLRGSPADGALRAGDVVTRLDGSRVATGADLVAGTRGKPAGTRYRLAVTRAGHRIVVHIASARLRGAKPTVVGFGIRTVTRNPNVGLPFSIRFKHHDIGGPSGGLIYALAIADMLDPADLAGGRRIAATGTIGIDGGVGPIGGLKQKAIEAANAKATILLVPRSEPPSELRGVRFPGAHTTVDDLRDAIAVLRKPHATTG